MSSVVRLSALVTVLVASGCVVAGCGGTKNTTALSDHFVLKEIGASLAHRSHFRLYVRNSSGELDYLATVLDPSWAEKAPFEIHGLKSKFWAMCDDGGALAYHYNPNCPGASSSKKSRLYVYEVGVGEGLVTTAVSIGATRWPKQLPPDMIAYSDGSTTEVACWKGARHA